MGLDNLINMTGGDSGQPCNLHGKKAEFDRS